MSKIGKITNIITNLHGWVSMIMETIRLLITENFLWVVRKSQLWFHLDISNESSLRHSFCYSGCQRLFFFPAFLICLLAGKDHRWSPWQTFVWVLLWTQATYLKPCYNGRINYLTGFILLKCRNLKKKKVPSGSLKKNPDEKHLFSLGLTFQAMKSCKLVSVLRDRFMYS